MDKKTKEEIEALRAEIEALKKRLDETGRDIRRIDAMKDIHGALLEKIMRQITEVDTDPSAN